MPLGWGDLRVAGFGPRGKVIPPRVTERICDGEPRGEDAHRGAAGAGPHVQLLLPPLQRRVCGGPSARRGRPPHPVMVRPFPVRGCGPKKRNCILTR